MPRPSASRSFVKPARAGSSVGVSKVHDASELAGALELAFAEDEKVLIETAISGREVEVAILEGRDGAGPRASLPGEIVLTTREFYDFEGKYLGGDGAEVVCPADLTDDEIARVQELGIRAFEAVDGRGLARVDFFLAADELYVNELNTMPGFTPISMFPKCWIASGMTYRELISELIDTALERAAGLASLAVVAARCRPSRRRAAAPTIATARRARRRSRRPRCRGRARPRASGRTSSPGSAAPRRRR